MLSGASLRAALLITSSWLIASAASVGYAHMAVSTASLRSLTAEADLVIRARIIEPDTWVGVDGARETQESILRVRILEVLKGQGIVGKELSFAQRGHGVAHYLPGDEALIFLRELSRSRELHQLGSTGTLRWYSTQEHDDGCVLAPKSRRMTLEAARTYAAIEKMPADERVQALRKVTVRLLASRDLRLATSALRDLVRAGNAPLVTEEDVPALTEVVHDPRTSIGVRIGLLVELEQRGLSGGFPQWVQLLRATKGADRLAVIHAAGMQNSPAVNAELAQILLGPDTTAAAAAAISLGSPGNLAAVPPLSKALGSSDTHLAMAAIRGLGATATPEAREALASAAASHPDASVRRRAQAELRILTAHRGGSR